MSSSTQALIPSPLKVNQQQPTSPSSQLSNLPLPATTQPPTRRIYTLFQSSTRTPRPKKKVHGPGLFCLRGSFHVASAHVPTCQWILLRQGPEFVAGGPASFCLPFLPPASLHLKGHVPFTMLQGTGQIFSHSSGRIRFISY